MNLLPTIACLFISTCVFAQNKTNFEGRHKPPEINFSTDSIISNSEEITVINELKWSKDIAKKLGNIKLSEPDKIFQDKENSFSRLIIASRKETINIPTIPLKYIVIVQKDSLIIGLSDIILSPFNIVIYNFKGELVSKIKLQSDYYKMDESQLEKLKNQFPARYECLKSGQHIFKEGRYYYAEFVTNCYNLYKDDKFDEANIRLDRNPYFKNMSQPLTAHVDGYKRIYHMFSDSDPFYDMIFINGEPFIIRLNDFEGKIVSIPLRINYLK